MLLYSFRDFLLFACTLAPNYENHTLYQMLYREVAGEIADFLRRRPNSGEFVNLQRIFRAQARRRLEGKGEGKRMAEEGK